MIDPRPILEAARAILLVDWPNPGVPRALHAAGFTVYCYSPGRYSSAELVADRPAEVDDRDIFPPRDAGDSGYLVFRRLDGRPDGVDIVSVYRPVAELAGIVADMAVPLGAGVIWLQAPVSDTEVEEARRIAGENGLRLVENADIAAVARSLVGGE